MCTARLAGERERKHGVEGYMAETPLQETHCKT